MNSRFKFVKSVDPQSVQTNSTKPRFGKLTLATTKSLAVESTTEIDSVKRITQTITHTTTTTTLTKAMDGRNEKNVETMPSEQRPKILLYESTILHGSFADKEAFASDLLTDDDTDSVGSSIDSSVLEEGTKNISPPTQSPITKIDFIDSQMQNLSVAAVSRSNSKDATDFLNLSHQFKHLDISQGNAKNVGERTAECSIQSLSSSADTTDRNPVHNIESKNESDEIIVLSDSEDENEENDAEKRRISQEPPFKPNHASDNDGAAFNASSNYSNGICQLNSETMQKVNHFFDNIPYTEFCENSFNTTNTSKSLKDAIYVSESEEGESIVDNSMESGKNEENGASKPHQPKAVERNNSEFSGNNIILDIPVVKSSSDQPHQLIRSQSGVRLTASNSSPIIRTTTVGTNPANVKRTSSNILLKKTGSSITVNSSNGQVNISAQIKINIHISPAEDSSSDASSDEKVKLFRKSVSTESDKGDEPDIPSTENTRSKDQLPKLVEESDARQGSKISNRDREQDENNCPNRAKTTDSLPVPKDSLNKLDESGINKTPRSMKKKNIGLSIVPGATPGKSSPKTPSTANKLKQFEYVPPKSLTKSSAKKRNAPIECKDKCNDGETKPADVATDFVVDTSIPVKPRDQRLLHSIYGEAWKTPDVIRSYSAIKGKPSRSADRAAVNETPSQLKTSRQSKGFNLFKRNINDNLNSTRLEEHAEEEISIIRPAPQLMPGKTSEKKAAAKTPTSLKKPVSSTKKGTQLTPSQSVLNKFASKPLENDSSTKKRPQRNVARKKILYSFDEDDEENEVKSKRGAKSKQSDDSIDSDFSNVMTDDESDSDTNFTSKSTDTARKVNGPRVKRNDKNKLIYLDLSSEEVVEVNENQHSTVSEEDIANVTRQFFEADLNNEDGNIPKKKRGRRLFTPQYDDIDEDKYETDTIRKKPSPLTDIDTDIEIPSFTQKTKLFDSKKFGSPSINKTSELDARRNHFKTPTVSQKSLDKPPRSASKLVLDSPPRTFVTYGFLKSLDVCASMLLCHPDAKKFRENFKSNKEELTKILYTMFNDQVFDGKLDLDVIWNKKLTTTAGRFIGKKIKSYIELSEKVLTSADRLRCTLIHEMCHAATWIFDKQKGHGATWKSWAKRANIAFPELPPITVCHNYDIEYKYTYKCDMCQSKSYSHSKSRKVENIRCSYCHGMISIYLNKKQNGAVVETPVRQASGFSKFVKEFYKLHKKPGVTHVEVMRILSTEYAKLSDDEKKKF